ncbi:MAG: carboxypeptidase regulatory-like domain-containing protein [Candidatus Moraniibacteriota bacterium]
MKKSNIMKKAGAVLVVVFFVFIFQVNFSLGSSDVTSVGLQVGVQEDPVIGDPINFNVQAESDSEIKIYWTDNSNNEEGFKLERKKDGDSFEVIATIAANSGSYTDSSLDPETKYIYRIRAYLGSFYSNYSSESNTTTDMPNITIESIEEYCDEFSIVVSLDEYYKNKELDFKLRIKNLLTNIESEKESQGVNTSNNANATLSISSLDWNTQYEISVSFKNDGDYSDWSDGKTAQTSNCAVTPSPTVSPVESPIVPELIINPTPITSPSPIIKPTPTEKVSNLSEKEKKKEKELIPAIVSEKIEEIRQVVQENQPAVTTASLTSLGVSSVVLASQLPSLGYLGALLRSIWSFLSGIFIKRKKVWGVVFDNLTGMPISMAAVSIYNKDDRKVDSRITDSFGAYSFLVSPGEYHLEIDKKGYAFNPNNEGKIFYLDQYSGEKISTKEYDIIKKDIPMSQNENTYEKAVQSFKIKKTFSYIFLLGGMIFSFGILIFDQSVINYVICLIYSISVLISYGMAGGKKWGTILNQFKKPEPFATIKVFEKETEKLKARTISDEKGRYFLILDPGRYDVKINTVSGVEKSEEILLKDRMAFKDNISIANA